MRPSLLFLLPLLAWPALAGTISGTTCPGTGCTTSLVSDTPGIALQITGAWTGQIAVELSNDGVTFTAARAYPVGGGTYTPAFTTPGAWMVPTGGFAYLRLRATSWTSGTATTATRPTPAPVPADVVRAVGSTFGEVAVSGVVDLGAATTAALTDPTCTLSSAPPVVALTTTPQDVPPTPLVGRTQVLVINSSSTQQVWCCVGVDCMPTSTAAYILLPNGGSRSFPLRETVPVRCRAAVGTADVSVEEASCG